MFFANNPLICLRLLDIHINSEALFIGMPWFGVNLGTDTSEQLMSTLAQHIMKRLTRHVAPSRLAPAAQWRRTTCTRAGRRHGRLVSCATCRSALSDGTQRPPATPRQGAPLPPRHAPWS
jgi:hypothetical protein